MDLYGNVPLWGSAETRRNNIGLIAGLARQYEQICTNMNMSPSPAGFLDYVSAYSPEGYPSDKNNTVKVLTCHSAKGLEWPMVILDELDSLQMDDKELWKKELAGVRHYRKGDEAVLHLFPTLLKKETNPKFGSSGSLPLPQPIMERMKELDFCGYVERTKMGRPVVAKAYYFFPVNQLHTDDSNGVFSGDNVFPHRIRETATSLSDRIRNSVRTRRDQLSAGILEVEEKCPLEEIEYHLRAGDGSLLDIPASGKKNERVKATNPFVSPAKFPILKNIIR